MNDFYKGFTDRDPEGCKDIVVRIEYFHERETDYEHSFDSEKKETVGQEEAFKTECNQRRASRETFHWATYSSDSTIQKSRTVTTGLLFVLAQKSYERSNIRHAHCKLPIRSAGHMTLLRSQGQYIRGY